MRVGIFGGTFDPVHLGHLVVAEQAREQGELDEVWFVPSARPPHKLDQPITSFDRRVDMLELAIAGEPIFQVSLVEKARPGPSYTVDTLADVAASRPGVDWSLILGADSLIDFPAWREPDRILEMASLLVVARPGWSEAEAGKVSQGFPEGKVRWLEAPLISIASRDLRRRAAEGRSLAYLTPKAVEVFIREKKVYRRSPE
jgi:nicotinate-nucleotide adenylyltransferase